jgi:NAD(P)H-dependent FMN reductase
LDIGPSTFGSIDIHDRPDLLNRGSSRYPAGVKILALCGSLQARSSNLTLLETAARLAPPGVEIILDRSLGTLPHFNPDDEGSPPAAVVSLRQAVAGSDAVLVACPEYGYNLPGALKNAIDWMIGSGELERKVVGVTASVPGPLRGRKGLRALCDTLGAVRARIVGGEPIVRGPGEDAAVAALLDALVAEAGRKVDASS